MMNQMQWDIEKYRTEHELEHHWNMKKKFMITHFNKFPENQLVSLAQTFYNIEVLGCRYDLPVMQRIKSLTEGMTCNRTTKEKEKFQRGFMAASNAATERVKARLSRPVETNMSSAAQKPMDFVRAGALAGGGSNPQSPSMQPLFNGKMNARALLESRKRRFTQADQMQQEEEASPSKQSNDWLKEVDIMKIMNSGPFGKAVVFESASGGEHPSSVIARSAAASHMTTNYSFIPNKGEVICKIQMDGLFLANAKGPNQKDAKEEASRIAVSRLKQTCFTVQVKSLYTESSSKVGKCLTVGQQSETVSASLDKPIKEDNIGSKMLKLMGWSGGGLGKDEQGVAEPVSLADHQITRSGLGTGGDFLDFKRKARALLEDFCNSEEKQDLAFSSDFSKEERKVIHELSRKYNLKSRSFGKEEDKRFLVIFKRISPVEIIEELIRCGGETERYRLIPPSSYLDL